jgi:hypothetical protein
VDTGIILGAVDEREVGGCFFVAEEGLVGLHFHLIFGVDIQSFSARHLD